MTLFTIYAFTNDKAQLVVKEASTSCKRTAELIESFWDAEGYAVKIVEIDAFIGNVADMHEADIKRKIEDENC